MRTHRALVTVARMRMHPLVFPALLLLAVACGLSMGQHADPADYDQSCSADADCTAVWEKACDDPGCNCRPAGAVNRGDAERFQSDEDRVRCTPMVAVAQCDCISFEAFCNGARCDVREQSFGTDGGP